MTKKNKITDALIGIAVGDALGVSFEFNTRDQMKNNPAKDMIGYGRYNVPAGTWSDDSSLTFCIDGIPDNWVNAIARLEDIIELGEELGKNIQQYNTI